MAFFASARNSSASFIFCTFAAPVSVRTGRDREFFWNRFVVALLYADVDVDEDVDVDAGRYEDVGRRVLELEVAEEGRLLGF